jgi:hypothetical protein
MIATTLCVTSSHCARSPSFVMLIDRSCAQLVALSRPILVTSLNEIAPTDGKPDKELLSKVKMPNGDGFISEQFFKLEAPLNRGSAQQAVARGQAQSIAPEWSAKARVGRPIRYFSAHECLRLCRFSAGGSEIYPRAVMAGG